MQAIMEEADLRLGEIKKASYEFDRDIVKGSINQRVGKVVSEKVTRYFEDKLKARVSNDVFLFHFLSEITMYWNENIEQIIDIPC